MNMHEHDCGCGRLPSAAPSPRIEHGVIMWYVGDTFSIDIDLCLKDQDGDDIVIGATDRVEVEFRRKGTLVHRFVCTAQTETIHGNTITLDFDDTVTKKFGKGEYVYDVYYVGEKRTTIANDNRVVVE